MTKYFHPSMNIFFIFFLSIIALNASGQKVALLNYGHYPVLVANENTVLNEWNSILKKDSIDANLKYLKIIQIDNAYYLRATGTDGYISTITLQQFGKENYLTAIGISCTGKSCGSDVGCLPTANLPGTCSSGCVNNDCHKTITNQRKGIDRDRELCNYYFSCDANYFL